MPSQNISRRLLDKLAARESLQFMATLRRSILGSLSRGGSVQFGSDVVIDQVLRALVAADALGFSDRRESRGDDRRRLLKRAQPASLKAVLDFAKRRAGMTVDDILVLETALTPEAARLATGFSVAVNQKLAATMLDLTERGAHVLEGRAAIAGVLDSSKALSETIFRTSAMLGYSAGRLAANDDPDIANLIWGYEYSAVLDDRVRPSHAALDGIKLPKDDPRWSEIMPPNGWNCRCSVVEIFVDEAPRSSPVRETKVIDGVPVVPGADDGWAFSPAEITGVLA